MIDSCSAAALATGPTGLSDIERALDGAALLLNFFLQQSDGVDQLLGPRRAAGNVYVDGDYLIHALHQRVIVEHSARSCTGSHRDYPFGFGHLLPELADHGSHFVSHATGNNDQVGLPR